MRVLFVCSGNAYRSPVAEALLNKFRPEIKADSAGTHPAIPISEAAKNYLSIENAQGFLKCSPEGLNKKSPAEYDLIIAMEQKHKEAVLRACPGCADRIVVWNIDDPYFLPHGYAKRMFLQIREKVQELANQL